MEIVMFCYHIVKISIYQKNALQLVRYISSIEGEKAQKVVQQILVTRKCQHILVKGHDQCMGVVMVENPWPLSPVESKWDNVKVY